VIYATEIFVSVSGDGTFQSVGQIKTDAAVRGTIIRREEKCQAGIASLR
jgi:hypothetical protein